MIPALLTRYCMHSSGFLVDWGLRSPLYPAAAAAAAEGAAKALGNAGVFPPGDMVEWVWQDSACDADRVRGGSSACDTTVYRNISTIFIQY